MSRVGGLLFVKVNGVQYRAKATNFEYNLGIAKKEAVVGIDGFHGYKELPITAYIQGAITDEQDLDVRNFAELTGVTVTAELANGKVVTFKNAHQAADLDQGTEEGEIPFRFEAAFGEEVS